MWKRDEAEPATPSAPKPNEATPPRETRRSKEPLSEKAAIGERAAIGRSITIKGEVTGDEDLLIQGRVDGSVELEQNALTVGAEGRVKANITARVITVEGEVEGDLKAKEQVVLRSSARVQGDLTAPRVVLEDGATFRGLVDMGDPPGKGESAPGAGEKNKEASDTKNASSAGAGKTGQDTSKPVSVGTPTPAGTGKDSSSGGTEKTKP